MGILDKAIEKELRTDPIGVAQELTGKSYKDDKGTSALGWLLLHKRAADKEALLSLTGDTYASMKADAFLSVCESIGFKVVLTIPFGDENQYIFYRRGCLLNMDTIHGNVNSASVYYNWSPTDGFDDFIHNKAATSIRSSGHWMEAPDDVWVGDHDVREALKHKLTLLETYGSFIYPWKARAFHGLVHYGVTAEKKLQDKFTVINEITENNVSQLPQEVRDMIPARKPYVD